MKTFSDMAIIENMLAQAILVPYNTVEEIRILPGLNIEINQETIDILKEHPDLKIYIESGAIKFIESDLDKDKVIEEQTPIIENENEKIPVSKPDSTGLQTPITNGKFYRFTLEELKAKKISDTLAGTILKLTPTEGWKGLEEMILKLQIDEKTQNKVKQLFE